MRASAHIAGEIADWPSKEQMALLLSAAGLTVEVGRYSVRVRICGHFVFQDYGGDRGVPTIDSDAGSVEELVRDAKLVSDALARGGVRHRFELYDDRGDLADYLHHEWPRGDQG